MTIVITEDFESNQILVDNEKLSSDLSIKNAKKCVDMLIDALDRAKELFDGCSNCQYQHSRELCGEEYCGEKYWSPKLEE